jgi:c-di-AMP phosphodiesterase-like protein
MNRKHIFLTSAKSPGLLRKLAVFVVTVALVSLVLMFSAVLLVIILIVGTIAWTYLWWKTRELRKQMRGYQARAEQREKTASNDAVFEGEVIRVVDTRDKE